MDFLTKSIHPLGSFDLTAIGIVLVVVMVIFGLRRLIEGRRFRPWDHDDMNDPKDDEM